MSQKSPAPLGASLVVLSSFFYASYGIWTKLLGKSFDGYTASAWRSVLVLVILVPIALRYHSLQSLRLRKNWPYVLGMFVAALFTWGPLYYAVSRSGVGISLTISYAGILIGTFLFARLFAGERLGRDKIMAALLGCLGLWLIYAPNTTKLGSLALFAALASGLSVGANYVFSKEIDYNSAQTTIVSWSVSVIANFIMAFIIGMRHPAFGLHLSWLYLTFFAIASVIASWAFVAGLKKIEAGAAGVLGLLEVVFAVLFGVIFFSERPGLETIAGVLMIVLAAAIPYLKDYNAQKGSLKN